MLFAETLRASADRLGIARGLSAMPRSRPTSVTKLPLVTAVGALSEDPIRSRPADTHRRGNSAGRLPTRVHPLGKPSFRLDTSKEIPHHSVDEPGAAAAIYKDCVGSG